MTTHRQSWPGFGVGSVRLVDEFRANSVDYRSTTLPFWLTSLIGAWGNFVYLLLTEDGCNIHSWASNKQLEPDHSP